MELIEREKNNALAGQEARIIAKVNSLVDTGLIRALYEASTAGVKIELIVRGICCLRPEMPGQSDNIRVSSIVGRFLEHSRVYYFYNGGKEEVFLSSADLMPRNLDHRVETLFPVEDGEISRRIVQILEILLKDNVKARRLMPDGHYKRVAAKGEKKLSSQEFFCKMAMETGKQLREKEQQRAVFVPVTRL